MSLKRKHGEHSNQSKKLCSDGASSEQEKCFQDKSLCLGKVSVCNSTFLFVVAVNLSVLIGMGVPSVWSLMALCMFVVSLIMNYNNDQELC